MYGWTEQRNAELAIINSVIAQNANLIHFAQLWLITSYVIKSGRRHHRRSWPCLSRSRKRWGLSNWKITIARAPSASRMCACSPGLQSFDQAAPLKMCVCSTKRNRLFDETNQRAAELAIINSVQEGLAAELNIQAIHDLVGDKIQEIFERPAS